MEKWTQDQAIAYECACDCITDLRGILTAQIYEESARPRPDSERLACLQAERSRLFHERAALCVTDDAAVARVRAEYGAWFRCLYAERCERQMQVEPGITLNPDQHSQ
ncbi:MAG: hypothetical protein FWD68_16965 [Alphaproteobacteria bacterium]|nr:hypothetical protein [Alphaproteobacteria bacterium]